ncbi:MAG: threonyl-tRNA synthetase, threonyl-tRNA synthetase [Patescibacteria group bacterium]|nr:threonyl-tRNA synthetase, threonyl-tRNA synthetase [Patescibacteria group bacterium]
MRHTLAHILAQAVLEKYPNARLTLGPAVDNGFYYDIDFGSDKISDEDIKTFQTSMRKNLKKWTAFTHREVSKEEALKEFAGNPYKEELINEISDRGEKITLYTCGEFTDLCRGGHLENPAEEISSDAFKLDRQAGAYWRGDEKNKMLTRIYGLAFETKEKLDEYIHMREEAEKRDHRKLGKELDLFMFSDVVGKGLPLWTEKGATIRRELERFIVDEELRRNYKHVYTPDIAKLDLYRKSGHYPYYKESMYAPIVIDDEEFMLRPMTCPHHFELYLSKPRSYRELPMRIGELAKLYRYEQSGELSGLLRVRGFCLADAHIICKDAAQAGSEVNGALDLIEYVCNVFGLVPGKDFWYRLSLGDRANTEKYYDDPQAWDTAENELRKVLQGRGVHFVEAEQEAAFYGPKIDIQMRDVRGKDNTAFTVQYDFVMPKRFKLNYTDSDGLEKEAIVVHRSSIGAIERVVAFLIEHWGGNMPTWLSPTQVAIAPVNMEKHGAYAEELATKLKAENIRTDYMDDDDSMGKKVRRAKSERIPYTIIIGDKDIEAGTITVQHRSQEQGEQTTLDEFIAKISKEIKERTLG